MRITAIILCFMVSGLVQAQVYRSIGKDGSVVYSDQPSEGAVEVQVKELETVKSLETPPLPDKPKAQEKKDIYSALKITSPENDMAVRDNAGDLDVSVSVKPALNSNHRLVLYLDGQEYSRGDSTTIKLENIDRGTHQLRVAVVDADGRQLIDSRSVTFHLLRYSVLQQPPKKNTN